MKLSLKIAALAVVVAAFGGGAAQAQWYSSVQAAPQPLYPYAPQPGRAASQPYAVEVAPGAYVIHRPGEARPAPATRRAHRAAAAPKVRPSRTKNDPALIEELRQRAAGKQKTTVTNTVKVVYKKPKVVETTRYVDDPPRVVERYTVVDDSNGEKKVVVEPPQGDAPAAGSSDKPAKGQKRVIQADAEITVLGPDRMTIQLYRKGERGKNARVN